MVLACVPSPTVKREEEGAQVLLLQVLLLRRYIPQLAYSFAKFRVTSAHFNMIGTQVQ